MARREDVVVDDFIRATSDGCINIEGLPIAKVVTISKEMGWQVFKDDNGKDKPPQRVIQFDEIPKKRIALNITNWDTIAAITGEADDDHWPGHKIELMVIPEPKSKKTGHAIRIRKPRPAPGTARAGGLGNAVADKILAKLNDLGTTATQLRAYLRAIGVDPIATVDADLNTWPATWIPNIQTFTKDPQAAMKTAVKLADDDIPF